MKPLHLKMQAFMPYAGIEQVDFRALGPHRLLMLSGETGAGKTTILDAMAYALFGQSTGGERQEAHFRSDYADDKTQTFVEFEFEVRQKNYRVRRYPPQKGKSTGKVELELFEGTAGERTISGKTKVTKKVVEILGYDLDQFRSVVVLPQGRFRDFLAAKSNDKEEILMTLLSAARYQRLEEALKEEHKRLGRKQSDVRKQTEGILERSGVESTEALEALVIELQAQVETSTTRFQARDVEAGQALQRFTRASEVIKQFEALEAASRALETLESMREARVRDAALVAGARRAAEVAPVVTARSACRAELDAKAHELTELEAVRVTAVEVREAAVAAAEVESGRASELDAARVEAGRLTEHGAAARRLHELEAARTRVEAECARARETVAKTKQAHEAKKLEQEQLQGELVEMKKRAATADADRATLQMAEDRLGQRRAVLDLESSLEASTEVEEDQAKQLGAVEAGAKEARTRFEFIYRRHLADYAAQLAEGLVEGEPCAVCGSTAHPAPAMPGEEAPDREEVDRAREATLEDEERLETARVALGEAKQEAATLRAQIEAKREVLGDDADTDISILEARRREHAETLQAALAADAALPDLEGRLGTIGKALESLARALANQEQSARKLEDQLQSNRAALEETRRTLPESLRTVGAVERRVAELSTLIEAMEEARRTADERLIEAETKLAEAAARKQSALQARSNLTEKLVRAEAAVAQALSDHGFDSFEDFESTYLPDAEIESIKARVREYDDAVLEKVSQRTQLEAQVEGVERPDLKAAKMAHDAAEVARHEARAALDALQDRASPAKKSLEDVQRLHAAHAEGQAEYGVVAKLAETAQGKNGFRVSFLGYVLAGLLDEVLIHASRRLRRMSDGRYTLHRKAVDAENVDRRQRLGLDLEVLDAHTSKRRDAGSLSGGEGFQASLALALGLADVVQAQAGGIELGAMFVDEGFGTQSAEALEDVLETLVELQRSGRLVGFISHVEGMKERMPANLHVYKTSSGSHVTLQIR